MKPVPKFQAIRFVLFFTFLACTFLIQAQQNSGAQEATEMAALSEAAGLIESNCNACHMPANGEKRLAPPMQMVKQHYTRDFLDQQSFTAAMIDYIIAPDETKSKMKGARAKFGLMPALSLPKEDLQKIADYLYVTDLGPVAHHGGMKQGHGEKKGCGGNCGKDAVAKKGKGGCGGCGGSCNSKTH